MKMIYGCLILLLAACGTTDGDVENDDLAMLEGTWCDEYWSVGFSGSEGVFTEFMSGVWLQALEQDWVELGTVKFRNIERVDDREWSMQELYARRTSEGEITELVWSGSGSIVMNENEDEITIQSSNPDTGMNTPAYTCVRLD